MSSRWNNPAIRFTDAGRTAVLVEPLLYQHPLAVIQVPKGFETDFASIPRIFWRILPKLDRHIRAAIVHDYLYYTNGVTRLEADAIFEAGMADLGTATWKRWVMYYAVRIGGFFAWRAHRKRERHG